MRITKRIALGAILALLAWPAAAQSDWKSTVFAYGWLPSLSGTFKVGEREGPVDVNADDVLSKLELAAFGRYRGETDHWSVVGDGMFVSFGGTRNTQHTETEVDLDALITQGTVGYKFSSQSEVYWGIQFVKFKTDVDVRGPLGNHRIIQGDTTMWDPVVGVRTIRLLSERWRLQAEGQIGGGANMDFTAGGMINVGYQTSDVISIWGGLRAIYADFDQAGSHNRLNAQATFWGPQAGVAFTF